MQAQKPTEDALEAQEQALMKELASIESEKKRLKTEDSSTTAASGAAAAASAASGNAEIQEGEKTADGVRFTLSHKRFVSVRRWKGKPLVDVREFYEKDGELLPGKSGLSMTPEQWEMLKSLVPSIDAALDKV